MQPTTRRRFLSSLGATAALGLAGCTGTTQLTDLKSRLGAANEREQRLEKELAKTQAELNETQHELDQVETQNDNLRTQLHHERQETKTLQTQLNAKNESISTLETRITKKEQRITELESLVNSGDLHGFTAEQRERATQLGNEMKNSIVRVENYGNGGLSGSGTAWHIGNGYYVTNNHVIQGGTSFKIGIFAEQRDNVQWEKAQLIGATGGQPDIALLQSPNDSPPALEYEHDSTSLSKGQPMVHVGHPMGVGSWIIGLGPFQHYGEFGNETATAMNFITHLPVRSGNSGSPVATLEGTVVGLTHSSVSQTSAEAHDPDYVHETYTAYPENASHMHSIHFDDYFDRWQ